MRPMPRVTLLALLALAPVLTACESFDLDKLDVFGLTEEKKLPGARQPLFPEGVPGVTQGIPQQYVRSPQQPADPSLAQPVATDAGNAGQTTAAAPAEEPAPPPQAPPPAATKPKPKPKPKTAATPPPPSPPPAPTPQQPAASQQQPQTDWPEPNQQQTPWPAPPAPGTFSR